MKKIEPGERTPALSMQEAARWIGKPRSELYKMAARGELATFRLGRRLFVPAAEVDALERTALERAQAVRAARPAVRTVRASKGSADVS